MPLQFYLLQENHDEGEREPNHKELEDQMDEE